QHAGAGEFPAQLLLDRVHQQALADVEHQVGDLDEAPELAAGHAPRVQLVDLAQAQEGHLEQRLRHGPDYRRGLSSPGAAAGATRSPAAPTMRTRSQTGTRRRAPTTPLRRRP